MSKKTGKLDFGLRAEVYFDLDDATECAVVLKSGDFTKTITFLTRAEMFRGLKRIKNQISQVTYVGKEFAVA